MSQSKGRFTTAVFSSMLVIALTLGYHKLAVEPFTPTDADLDQSSETVATLVVDQGATKEVGADSQPKGRQYTPPYYVFTPDISHDIVSENLGAIGPQPFVDNLAWKTFVALNWPVPKPIVERGVPDRQNVIGGFKNPGGDGGGSTVMPTGPVVWETYKDSEDIFQDPPKMPAPFDAPESIPNSCKEMAAKNAVAAQRTLTQTSKVSDILSGTDQAFTDAPLIDLNGEYVWYDIKNNRVYFDYVVENEFYDSTKQKGKRISFPTSSNTTQQEPTVKVKAAWKVMGDASSKFPDNPSKFYTTKALVVDPDTEVCRVRLMGLVGLHVVMKTKQLPQWMWATFEHVDNAPDQADVKAGKANGKYNFFNPACIDCPINTPRTKDAPKRPTQVVRIDPISGIAPNQSFQNALRSLREDNVWQYYMLVNAQWSFSRDPLGVPTQPPYLANTTMETYLQELVEDEKMPHGCINCHGTYAAKSDLDFQILGAYPRPSDLGKRIVEGHFGPSKD